MINIRDFPRQRRHTLYFLQNARKTAPVLLTVEIDASAMIAIRQQFQKTGRKISYISLLIKVISEALQLFPQANSVFLDGWCPKIVRFDSVVAKFTLDKMVGNERIVVSAVVENSQNLDVEQIQSTIDEYKNADYEGSPQFSNLRKLNNLNKKIGQWIYHKLMSNPYKRQKLQGSFTITSLGHRDIDVFCPISSNTMAFGVGTIKKKAVVVDDHIAIRPILPLSLVFDHRVIDGALAADIFHCIKTRIENNNYSK